MDDLATAEVNLTGIGQGVSSTTAASMVMLAAVVLAIYCGQSLFHWDRDHCGVRSRRIWRVAGAPSVVICGGANGGAGAGNP